MLSLLKNKYDHLCYWWVTCNLPSADYLVDIGSGNHPQDIIRVNHLMRCYDPTYPEGVSMSNGVCKIKGTWVDAIDFLRRDNHHYTVTLIDVVEHLIKPHGVKLLFETQQHADRIVVFTPLGFMEQDDGPFNTHRSGWYSDSFGDGWVVHTFPSFHRCDFKGKRLGPPHGAILAIWERRD